MRPINKEQEKKRKDCIKELNKIEKKYGSQMFIAACNRKITIDRQSRQQQHALKEAEKNLEKLKSGKPLSY